MREDAWYRPGRADAEAAGRRPCIGAIERARPVDECEQPHPNDHEGAQVGVNDGVCLRALFVDEDLEAEVTDVVQGQTRFFQDHHARTRIHARASLLTSLMRLPATKKGLPRPFA